MPWSDPRLACVVLATSVSLGACAEPGARSAAMSETPAPPEIPPAQAPLVPAEDAEPAASWQSVLADRVATFGHRNVIAVVDSAYPAHSPPGIETIATHVEFDEVLAAVLAEIRASRRVRARALLDRELDLVPESDAPGMDAFRARLAASLAGLPVESVPHEDLLERLGRASESFRVLILKTDLELPYTSVFLQLECGYWTDDAEKRLREAAANPPR